MVLHVDVGAVSLPFAVRNQKLSFILGVNLIKLYYDTLPFFSNQQTCSSGQKHTIWTHFALESEDQLRLKMAWSLSQIVSVGLPPNADGTHDMEATEGRLAFYDMFVKNAYGK